METIKIKQATKKGYIEIPIGGCFDASFPHSGTHRGRVQGGGYICPTICTIMNIVVIEGNKDATESNSSD